MNKIWKRIKKIVLISLIIAIAVYLLCFIIGGFFVIYDATHLKERLDNPYINDDFGDWQNIEIDGFKFMVPSEWSLSSKDNNYMLDSNGNEIALVLIGNEYDCGSEEFFEELLYTEVTDLRSEQVDSFERINAAYLSKCLINKTDTYYCLEISASPSDVTFIFFDVFESEKALIDYAQAITYYIEMVK